jgi:predicted amidophosphoribosyltransferase
LLRILDTPAQHTLKRVQRLSALDHAFAMDPLRAAQVQGKRVVLVDDVMTTGASLHAAARVLRAAGAIHITGLVLARTE